MQLIPHQDHIELAPENPLEKSVMSRWLKCNAKIQIRDIPSEFSSSGTFKGIIISFEPKQDELVPAAPVLKNQK